MIDDIIQDIQDFFQGLLADGVIAMLRTAFNFMNFGTEYAGVEIGKTPQDWNPDVFSLIETISNNVIVPIGAIFLTYVICLELITSVIDKNNLKDFDTFIFFKFIVKSAMAIWFLSNTFTITMALFDLGQYVVNQAAGTISTDTTISSDVWTQFEASIRSLGIGELFGLLFSSLLVLLGMIITGVLIIVILIGRMMEIYLYCSVAPIPFATLMHPEWGQIGKNYIKSILALAFQGFFMMVCLGIYARLISNIATAASDINNLQYTIVKSLAYTIVLCIMMFKTHSISKSIFNAH